MINGGLDGSGSGCIIQRAFRELAIVQPHPFIQSFIRSLTVSVACSRPLAAAAAAANTRSEPSNTFIIRIN